MRFTLYSQSQKPRILKARLTVRNARKGVHLLFLLMELRGSLRLGNFVIRPSFYKELPRTKSPVFNTILFSIVFLSYFSNYSQSGVTPKVSSFEPVNFNNPTGQTKNYYFNSQIELQQNKLNQLNSSFLNGATSQSVEQNLNSQAMKMMGYTPPAVPPSDPVLAHQFIVNQYNQQYAGNLRNEIEKQKHFVEVMNEANNKDNNFNSTSENTKLLQDYQNAFSKINDMLSGKTKLSFVNATYIRESSYGNVYMSYNEFYEILKQSAEYIKQMVTQQNAPLTPHNLHYAIQQFMGTKTSIKIITDDKKGSKTITHYPFKYDYEDYEGKKDYRNYFATKCLATGTGQCSSMPDVYLLLCEMLGINGYKTFAPMHSFIKYKNIHGAIINYEPTSHYNLPDKWYQENMGVSSKAKANGIYLDTLTKKQCVANALVDLAISYMMSSDNPDTAFVQKCLSTSDKYLSKKKNLYGHLAKSSLLIRQLNWALRQHGVKDLSEVNNFPDTSILYQRLQQNEEYLRSLGYEEMPKEIYDQMLEQQNNKTNSPDAKTVKSLFQTN